MLHGQLLTAVLALISFALVTATTSAPTSAPTSQYVFFATFSNYDTSDFDSTTTAGASLRTAYISAIANLSSVNTDYVAILAVQDERRNSGGTTVVCETFCTTEAQSDLPSLMYDATSTGFGETFVAAAAGLGVTVDTPTTTHYAVWAEPTDGSGGDGDSCGNICVILIVVFSILACCCCLLAAAGWYYMRGYAVKSKEGGHDEPIDETLNFASFRTPAGEWAGLGKPANQQPIERDSEEEEDGDLGSNRSPKNTWAQAQHTRQVGELPAQIPQMHHQTNDLVLNVDDDSDRRATMPQYHDSGDAAAEEMGQVPKTVLQDTTQSQLQQFHETDLQKMREIVMSTLSEESQHADERAAATVTSAEIEANMANTPRQANAAKKKGFRGSYDAPAQAESMIDEHHQAATVTTTPTDGRDSQALVKYPLTRTMSI